MRPVVLSLLLTIMSLPAAAADIHVAAASDLTFCLQELNAIYKKANPGANVVLTTGSSGKFFAQIQNGAPFDVYMSADMEYPRKLADAGMADRNSLFQYGVGQIAVWSTDPRVDVSKGVAMLADAATGKVAIANPAHAPYGRAAQAAMEKAGVWKSVQPKLVIGENISQAAQFVQTGNAQAGIIAVSLLKAPTMTGVGKYAVVPQAMHPPIEQGAVLTAKGKTNPDAGRYIAFLKSAEARAVFDRFGFLLPTR